MTGINLVEHFCTVSPDGRARAFDVAPDGTTSRAYTSTKLHTDYDNGKILGAQIFSEKAWGGADAILPGGKGTISKGFDIHATREGGSCTGPFGEEYKLTNPGILFPPKLGK